MKNHARAWKKVNNLLVQTWESERVFMVGAVINLIITFFLNHIH